MVFFVTHHIHKKKLGNVPDSRFVEAFPDHKHAYMAVKEKFLAVCRRVDECYAELNSKHQAMQEWARQCERETYAPLLFILKKRGFQSAIQFYSDHEAVHERRVETVAYYILQYMDGL